MHNFHSKEFEKIIEIVRQIVYFPKTSKVNLTFIFKKYLENTFYNTHRLLRVIIQFLKSCRVFSRSNTHFQPFRFRQIFQSRVLIARGKSSLQSRLFVSFRMDSLSLTFRSRTIVKCESPDRMFVKHPFVRISWF